MSSQAAVLTRRTGAVRKTPMVYIALYRHPEQDTKLQLAVSTDRKTIKMLTRKDTKGNDLATVERYPVHGVALMKMPVWLALDRKISMDYPSAELAKRPWHSKDMRTYTAEEESECRQYYEFADRAKDAHRLNGHTESDTRRSDSWFGAMNQ